jgi:hypothetical protein
VFQLHRLYVFTYRLLPNGAVFVNHELQGTRKEVVRDRTAGLVVLIKSQGNFGLVVVG